MSSFDEHDVNTLAPLIVRMAAKAAIERAHNELARFVEREQARQDVNIQFFIFCIIALFSKLIDFVLDFIQILSEAPPISYSKGISYCCTDSGMSF